MTYWDDLAGAFETRTRDNGDVFYVLADGSPEWMTEAVRAAHDGALPNDWAHKLCAWVADTARQYDEPEDYAGEIADSVVNRRITHELLDWLASHGSRQGLADEALEAGAGSVDAACRQGCYAEAEQIFYALAEAVRAHRQEQEA